MLPIGRHDASGLSLLLRAMCFASRSFAYGVSGSPPVKPVWMSRKFVVGGVPGGGGGGGGAPRRPAAGLYPRHVPEKSGFPSGIRGAGAFRSGLPSAVNGVGNARYSCHCAETVIERAAESAAPARIFATGFMR